MVLAVLVLVLASCTSATTSPTEGAADTSPASTQNPVTAPDSATEESSSATPAEAESASDQSEAVIVADDGPVMNPCTGGGPVGLPVELGRTDVQSSGNKQAGGGIRLLTTPRTEIELPAPPVWVVRHPGPDGPCEPSWYVVLDDDTSLIVASDGSVLDAGPAVQPPQTDDSQDVFSAYEAHSMFENPLPDTRVVQHGPWLAALADPTDRYPHGVLGDRIEAGAVEIVNMETDERRQITIDPPAVIEGISPMFIDIDPDRVADPVILVTVSDSSSGARLALYNLDGSLRAESDPIGRGNRWRNQLGASLLGPNGEFEIVDIRTPHLDGVVEYFRIADDRLELAASTTGYTTHVIGSRNLDLGLIVDADEDKLPEIVVPSRDLRALAVLERSSDQVIELGRVELDGKVATNLATQWINGQAWLAVGTDDRRLVIFGDPERS